MIETLAAVDVVLVGLGAANGIVAHVLTEAGLDVAALEAGPRVSPRDFAQDEVANRVRLSRPKALYEVPTWRTDGGETATPSRWPMLMVNAVGGTSVHYEGLSIRFCPWNFESRTRTIERYGAGAIPAGSTLADWPFSYDELEPYYGLAERAVGVSGAEGNPFEGPRSAAFPMPALRQTGWNELLADAARRLGWHPFAAPAAINSVAYDGRPACTYCGFCMLNVCHCEAKGATDVNVIRHAEATGRLRVETWSRVTRIETGPDGLATGATFVRDGRECFQPARLVLIGTFTYENVRLLLLSTSKAHPNGLGNDHGQVGRDYMAHVTPFVFGRFPGRRLNLMTGVGSQATCVEDHNADNFDHAEARFIGGGMLSALQELTPLGFARAPLPPSVPGWGSGWKAWVKANAQSVGSINGQVDALPYEDTYLDLDPAQTDPHGVPVVRVTHQVHDNERAAATYLEGVMRDWLLEAGAAETWAFPGRFVEARHCYGGTRMGHDRETSVVDGHGLLHDAPNVGVVGASTFPTAGGVNPTLTVQATAWRTAEHVVRTLA
jgi:gluconate 2-dehydrogenase alpha chain